MPGIDFTALRDRISILDENVLRLLEFKPHRHRGGRLRGLCPLQCSDDPSAFVVNVATHQYYCHACHHYGDQLDLWSETQRLTVFDAAKDLSRRLNIRLPEIHRW